MYYKIITMRTAKGELLNPFPVFDDAKLKYFGTYNAKITVYTLEGEQKRPVDDAYKEISTNRGVLVSIIDEGSAPFPPSDSNVWGWKVIARHYAQMAPNRRF